ncbi:MAG: lysine--tRNA ligase [Candidatus Komeilibacteria bacterium]|nr:lysine--tRNA ligase [Candidatus Komeilibacteria bacterium]
MPTIDEIRESRMHKLETLRSHGIDPYPPDCNRDTTIADLVRDFDVRAAAQKKNCIAGRIMSLRLHGGSAFADLFDGTGRIQIYLKSDKVGEEQYKLFVDTIDASDFIEVAGEPFLTKRGEKSVMVSTWRILAKSLRPIPDEWFGLKDEEERYRKRYIDLLLNEKSAVIARQRSAFWNSMRQFLLERDFIEVETPVLENTTGGAEARPFITHHNALDIDVYLRISAGELWQKRLLVGGLPRVFEIGRIFRNEGMSREHLQDYTQLEFYMAYSDYQQGMEMTKELYRRIAHDTFGRTEFTIRGHKIDLAGDWDEYDFSAMIQKEYKFDPLDVKVDAAARALDKAGIEYDATTLTVERGVDMLWKKIRKNIVGPGFLVGVPVYLEPLAKRSRDDNRVVERFQVIIAGSEVGKGFSELNDPTDQRERFMRQQELRDAGDEEAQMADMDFVEALEYGMPPAFGFGVSERFFSFLLDEDVREAQLFPLMRPKK